MTANMIFIIGAPRSGTTMLEHMLPPIPKYRRARNCT